MPPAATARLERFRDDQIRTSFLSVPDAASLDGVGLPFVGEVMGCIVEQIQWTGTGTLSGLPSTTTFVDGRPVTTARAVPNVTTSGSGGWDGYAPYVRALYAGYRIAISRMLSEATAMGAVGVVGVRMERKDMGEMCTEFMALGTAVRAESGTGLEHPFVTDLSGADVSKALIAGWVPVSLAFGISVSNLAPTAQAYRRLSRQTRRWSGNGEVEVLSELVGKVRADARDQFYADAARSAADAAIVSTSTLEMVGGDERYAVPYLAEAVVSGSTLARFRSSGTPRARTLTVLPLRPSPVSGGASA